MKQLWSRWQSDQKMNYIWWLWLRENSVDHHLLNYLPVSWRKKKKSYITTLLPKNKIKSTPLHVVSQPGTHGGQVGGPPSAQTSAPSALISNLNDFEISDEFFWGGAREGSSRGGEDCECLQRASAVPNPASVCWNFKKAQRAQDPGCLSLSLACWIIEGPLDYQCMRKSSVPAL